MLASRYKHGGCLKVLALSGADFGLLNSAGRSQGFRDAVLDAVKSGAVIRSTDTSVFSPLTFVAKSGDLRAVSAAQSAEFVNVDEQDENGFSWQQCWLRGKVTRSVFRLLVFAGANMKLRAKSGETAASLQIQAKIRSFRAGDARLRSRERWTGRRDTTTLTAPPAGGRPRRRASPLSSRDLDVNTTDADGYTPLMLAARAGNARSANCSSPVARGCDLRTKRGDGAVSRPGERGVRTEPRR
ncbi:hypothetical protein HPP92_021446 [Vanilla planifolia]|uniref:Uncharacterized protein n=1 Tax=Vanilla planifolia TaxID=51239 RepID=A0A835PWL7_VANPL|nr:hypothetical protein HPP92_021446 [Vanilla planifolia]